MLKTFIIEDKSLSIYLMIVQKLDVKLFINQNRIKQQEQNLKY